MKLLRTLRNSTIALMATITFAGSASAEMLANSDLSLDPATQTEQIEEMIETVFQPMESQIPGITDKMVSIADCESYGGRDGNIMHIGPDGNVILNSETQRARGVFQIVPNPHNRMAATMGLDLNQVADQVFYARFLVQDRVRMGDGPYTDWVCA
jgi:hypothetical protein